MDKKTKVLIVDDSALARQAIKSILVTEPSFEILQPAQDPYIAAKSMRKVIPDVIILDIEMPKMDGITFLRKLMRQHPIPTIICSTLAAEGARTTMAALEAGAVDIIQKPTVGTRAFFEEHREKVVFAVKAASQARVRRRVPVAPSENVVKKEVPRKASMIRTTDKVIVVGASTGGTEALRVFLEGIPLDSPGIVIVQHMPGGFTGTFAKRLNDLCKVNVREASGKERILRGQAIIANGNYHLRIVRSGAQYYTEVKDGDLVSRHKPSVNVLFDSAAEVVGANAVGVLMTGMGEDGAKGLLKMKEAGSKTLAQDQATSVVYGMPAAAARIGAAQEILPLEKLSGRALELCK